MKKSNAVLLGTIGLVWVSVALYALGFRGDDPDFKDLDFVYTESTVDLGVGVKPDGRVEINNMGGKIDIECWDYDSVHVTGKLQKRVKEIKVASDGHKVTVMAVYYDKKNGWQIQADLTIKMPRKCRITAHSISADIIINDHGGSSVFAHTVSGNVDCRSGADDIDVKAVSGNLTLKGNGKKAVFKQVSGNFDAAGNYSDVSGESISGNISIATDTGGVYSLKSTSGDVGLTCGTADNIQLNVKTVSGDIRTGFKKYPRVSHSLKSNSGTISGYIYTGDGEPQRFTADKKFSVRDEKNAGRIVVNSVSGDIILGYTPENL